MAIAAAPAVATAGRAAATRAAGGQAAKSTGAKAAGKKAGTARASQAAEAASFAPLVTPDGAEGPSRSSSQGGGRKSSAPSRKASGSRTGSRMPGVVSWAWSGNRKLLTAQFLLCVVILGLGTLLAPSGQKGGMPRTLVKGSALCGVFLVLSLLTTGGKGSSRAATAIGTLITASYVLTSKDVHNVVSWLNAFFSKDGDVSTSGSGEKEPSNSPDIPGNEANEGEEGTGAGSVFV